MNRETSFNERAFSLDCSLALHQRLCWLICALAAVAGALAILRFTPHDLSIYFTIALAILLMLIYQWMAQAPIRALKSWMKKREENRALIPKALGFVIAMEKALPAMKRKEMAYTVACAKGVLLFEAGKCREALSLLQSFDRIWDESQREHLNALIDQMKSLMEKPIHGEEE